MLVESDSHLHLSSARVYTQGGLLVLVIELYNSFCAAQYSILPMPSHPFVFLILTRIPSKMFSIKSSLLSARLHPGFMLLYVNEQNVGFILSFKGRVLGLLYYLMHLVLYLCCK